MKALIDAMQFKQLIEGVKHAVSNDKARPMLGYIKLEIKSDRITGYAVDGYRCAKAVITNTVHAPTDEFIAYIKPFTVPKQTVDMIYPIEIIKDDDNFVTVAMQTGDGKTELTFEQPSGEFVDVESVISGAQEHDRELGVNAVFVAEALNAIAKSTHDSNKLAVIQTKENSTQAFTITGKGEGIDVTQIVLPIRMD
ncbi:MAG: hypothetical protein NC489_27340 [Ruminococcus flavefaciens]|nr:hypothetical protein [Ruminococcus flavefaciens]